MKENLYPNYGRVHFLHFKSSTKTIEMHQLKAFLQTDWLIRDLNN